MLDIRCQTANFNHFSLLSNVKPLKNLILGLNFISDFLMAVYFCKDK